MYVYIHRVQTMMEYQTMVILAQTVVGCIFVTIGIMYCFFEEAEKEKQD